MALNTADEILNSVLPEWHKLLQGWAADGSLVAAAQEALMLSGEPEALNNLVAQWSAGDFSGIPRIVLLPSAEMNGAMGAYAISTETIYLNADWLATASKHLVNAVFTEELGHHLDALLNELDTPGDEGEYFARLLSGENTSVVNNVALRTQDDWFALAVQGVSLPVEGALVSSSNIQTTGSALVQPSAINLVSVDNGYGAAWSKSKIDLSKDWSSSFVMNAGGGSGTSDGFTFTINGDPRGASALGDGGQNLGFFGVDTGFGIINSYAVLFDMWTSGPRSLLGFAQSANTSIPQGTFQLPLSLANNSYPIALNYSATQKTLSVTIGNQVYQQSVDLQSTLGKSAYLGLTAANGGGTMDMVASTWNITATEAIRPVVRGNSLYRTVTGSTWKLAEANSVALGGHLAAIESAAENGFLVNAYATSPYNYSGDNSYYIGYSDEAVEGTWQWVSGSSSAYSNWSIGEPQGAFEKEDYAEFLLVFTGNRVPGEWGDNFENIGSGTGIAEIPIISSITRTGTVREGAGVFTTSINLTAGTPTSGNLAEDATVYWKIDGITADDLASGALTGSGVITNGKLDIQHSLKADTDTGEQLIVSVFSDTSKSQLIDSASVSIVDQLWLDFATKKSFSDVGIGIRASFSNGSETATWVGGAQTARLSSIQLQQFNSGLTPPLTFSDKYKLLSEGETFAVRNLDGKIWGVTIVNSQSISHGGTTNGVIVDYRLLYSGNSNSTPTGSPTLLGTPKSGSTLSVDTVFIQDSDNSNISTPRFSYGWEVSSDNASTWSQLTSTDATDNNNSYTLTAAENGKRIRSVVSYKDSAGNNETLYSGPSVWILDTSEVKKNRLAFDFDLQTSFADFGLDIRASFSGGSEVQTWIGGAETALLTTDQLAQPSNGSQSLSFSSSYKLLSEGETFAVRNQDGKTWAVTIVDSRSRTHGGSIDGAVVEYWLLYSGRTNSSPTGSPSITGTLKAGSTLSLDASAIKDVDNFSGYAPSYNYGWEVSSDNGATWTKLTSSDASDNNSSYTLATAEVGKRVRGVVSYLDGYGTNESVVSTATLVVSSNNQAPSNLALSSSAVNENIAAGSAIATLSTTDPDATDTFSYALVSGTGSTDNAAFSIAGNQLKINTSPDFESKSSYSIRIRSTDAGGLFFEKVVSLSVSNVNETPTDLTLSASSFNENIAAGSTIATLGTTDPDSGDTFSYALVSGTGSTDNAAFSIAANQLKINTSPDFESKSSYSIRIRSTDAAGLSFEKVVALTVSNVNEGARAQWLSYSGQATDEWSGGIATFSNGDVATAFSVSKANGASSVIVQRLNANGAIVWSLDIGADYAPSAGSVLVSTSDTVYVTGGTKKGVSGESGLNDSDIFAAAISSSGQKLWYKNYGIGIHEIGSTAVIDANGNILLEGRVSEVNDAYSFIKDVPNFYGAEFSGGWRGFQLRVNPTDGSVSQAYTTGSGNSGGGPIAIDRSRNIAFIAGYTFGAVNGVNTVGNGDPNGANTYLIARNENTGAILWTRMENWMRSNVVSQDAENAVYFVDKGNLEKVNTLTGQTIWIKPLSSTTYVLSPIAGGGILLSESESSGTLAIRKFDSSGTETGSQVVYHTDKLYPRSFIEQGDGTILISGSTPGTIINVPAGTIVKTGKQFGIDSFILQINSAFSVSTAANQAPTDLTLSASSFNENIAAGSTIATLGTTDPDSADTFSYALVSGTGSTDNAAFSIAGNQLKINTSPDFESKSSYSIRIRSTDAGGLSFERVFALNVNDLPEQATPPQGSTNTPSTTGNNSPATSVSNGSGTTIINNTTINNITNNINSNNTTTNNINNSISITGSFNGNTSAQALAGSLKLEDPAAKTALPINGDSAIKTLAQLTASKPLSDAARQLLDRYIIKDPSSSSSRKASASDAGFIDFTVRTGSLKSLTAEIALASEVKATAYVKVNPNTGEAFDFTFDPVTGLGAELLDTNKNGLVDSLRIHLQDGGLGDVDGAVNGTIRDPGVLAEAPRTPVYRFYRNGVHFYTTSDAERDNVIKQSYGANTSFTDLSANPQAKDPITGGWGYKYEGVAYQALDTQGTALYRFFSPSKGYHFVTTNAKEALEVIQNSVGSGSDLSNAQGKKLLDNGWGFQFEGNTYKVSTIAQTGMDNPVYRFFNAKKGVHFYSSSMVEAKSVITNSLGASYATDSWISSTSDAIKAGNTSTPAPLASGWGYSFEGIAWYV